MLIKPQKIKMKWHQRNIRYYEERGYVFTDYGDFFEVDVEHLPKGCNEYVLVLCDYCLENGKRTICSKPYQSYIKQNRDAIIKKDCCYVCRPLKIKESNRLIYGKESTNQVEKIRKKQIETNKKKYGGENVMASEKIRKKVVQTNLERYGSKAPAQNDDIKAKISVTNHKKYGGISPTLNEEVRNKQKSSMKKKYGVEYGMQNKNIMGKARKSLYGNGTVPTSNQQRYIHSLVGGELNYPFKNYSLDIGFPNKRLYVECDFGGHNLQVKFGNKSEEQFQKDERKRYYSLYRAGWKAIRIITQTDKVPSPEKVSEMMEYAKRYLDSGHSWIHFELDKASVIGNNFEEKYDFGKLLYMYQIDLKDAE